MSGLVSGLQNRVRRFESARNLQSQRRIRIKISNPSVFLSTIGFVETGVLRSYIEKEGEDISDFLFEGSFATSYRSFLTREASVGSIQALEDSVLYCLSKSNYDQLLQTSDEGYELGKYIADTLFIKKCRKETSLLMDNAFERYKLLLNTYPQIEQHLSQCHIAAYLGIKPESLSRLKSLNIGQ